MASIDRIALLELLRKCGADGNVDFLKEALQVLVQSLMEAEVSAKIGAERYERNEGRTTYRNGYRERDWDTRVGVKAGFKLTHFAGLNLTHFDELRV